MINRSKAALAGLCAAAGFSLGAARASDLELVRPGAWSVDFDGGVGFDVDSKFHGGGPSADGTIQLHPNSYTSVYGRGKIFTLGVGLSYGVTNTSEVFLDSGFDRGQGDKAVNVGYTAGLPGTPASAPVIGRFQDYNSYGLYVGYRQYIPGFWIIDPYVSLYAGGRYFDQVAARFGTTDQNANYVKLYSASIVPSGGIGLGARAYLTPRVSFNFETGLRYDYKPRGSTDSTSSFGLPNIADKGERFVIPTLLKLKVDF